MQHPGGVLLPPVQTLVATVIFAMGENAYQVLLPVPVESLDTHFIWLELFKRYALCLRVRVNIFLIIKGGFGLPFIIDRKTIRTGTHLYVTLGKGEE